MTEQQITSLGPELSRYVGEFDDCFSHPDTRGHLRHYVQGQLSDLPRKSVEPMAHLAQVPPRTLQEFLALSEWDQDRLRRRVQEIVARDHADAEGIGIIDESGHPKKGDKTACVQRQYCGNTGKVDNCIVTVHLAYAKYDTSFRTMLDSTLYFPKESWSDPERRKEAAIPDSVVYRSKYHIALEQLRRALDNGVRLGWVTADEWYGEKPAFIQGLEALELRYVLEIPCNLMGWLREPLSSAAPRSEVRNLCRHSSVMTRQPWKRFYVKETDKGAVVWEIKSAPFWTLREEKVVGPYRLLVARDVLDPQHLKYFISDADVQVPLTCLLHVAFARWPVERCLQDEKTELGLSHFECRKYPAIERHLLITQVSHLFLARQTARLRGEKSTHHDLPGAHRLRCTAGLFVASQGRASETIDACDRNDHMDTNPQRRRPRFALQNANPTTPRDGNTTNKTSHLPLTVTAVAL